ncbi:hypothetical protein BSL78_02671 [Apostichopus japonicus]|uniref:Reverse transcriptase/retrotransposon-derived protein RNase H-like domain-containing protein n=1 Tax=Stichopus japonicus TaxID=307972 RepID=A0A2G8LJD5_STIJA|nr:hypothetical protein BSL78_02671 [Apostichopus japonicus]
MSGVQVPLPPKLNLQGNLKKNWEQFKQLWDSYEIVTNLVTKDDKGPSETFDEYVVRLRILASTCEFGALKDELIRDRIVCGITSRNVRKRLLQTPNLDLTKCINECKAAEVTQAQLKGMACEEGGSSVNYVKHKTRSKYSRKSKAGFTDNCKFCGKKHELQKLKCPAYGKTCTSCGKQNHFASKCTNKDSFKQKAKFVRQVEVESDENESDSLCSSSEESVLSVTLEGEVNCVNFDKDSPFETKIFATLEVNGNPIKMQVDSGATCNVIADKHLPPEVVVKQTNQKLTMYSVVGQSDILRDYKDVFEGFGHMPGIGTNECRLASVLLELFQQKIDQNLEGLSGVFVIADDILITGTGNTVEEANADHVTNLKRFLQRCRERSIKLNKDKFEYKCEEVAFIGHVLSKEGLRPDPRKVEAILKMPKPENVADIQRFVGMVKYLSKFLPALSDKSEPLRRLTHKDVDWTWSIEQDRALAEIKQLVTTAPVLKYFNPDSQTEGQGDASEKGLGFCLIQNGQPITYCSRALTPAETRYSQIEKNY